MIDPVMMQAARDAGFACATGDCPHEKQSQCDEALANFEFGFMSRAEEVGVAKDRIRKLHGYIIRLAPSWLPENFRNARRKIMNWEEIDLDKIGWGGE